MKKFILVLIAVGFFSICSAGECVKGQVCTDAKGSYILNDLGSKGRLSAKDLELKKQGLPYGITLEESDKTVAEIEKDALDRQANAIKQAEIKAAQEKEALIQAKVREGAIADLQSEGKLDNEEKLVAEPVLIQEE